MNKLLSIVIVLCFVLGGLEAMAIQPTSNDKNKIVCQTLNLSIDDLTIKETEEQYLRVSFSQNDKFLLNPGEPILPKFTKIFELPFGATSIDVQVKSSEKILQTINKQIQPSPAPIPLSPIENYNAPLRKDEQIYQSNEPYPSKNYQYNVGVGINEYFEHITYVTVHWYPIQYIPIQNIITITENVDITVTYTSPESTPFPQTTTYDMVIIAPATFSDALQPLIDHKNSYGIKTTLKTTKDIYTEYNGFDKSEQIKYFIKDAIEQWNIKYVLLAGGLKSTIYAKARDTTNIGASGWHIPVRYSNIRGDLSDNDPDDPGFPTDLYYADIYKEGGAFENWDSDGDGILAEWINESKWPDDIIDSFPDVAIGRLAFSDIKEVKEVVNKIITYETTSYGSDWFKKMIVFSGDGFLDQLDLNIQWDTNGLATGVYIINAQSYNPEGDKGPVDTIHVTLNDTVASQITFNHDDHLNPILQNGYPALPIAEIVSVSEGNILGNTDVAFKPTSQAYCNDLFWWGNVSYADRVLTIRGKSYDPKPYGNMTNIHVWVENNHGDVVFSYWRNNTTMYYEGEWVTGEKAVNGRGGALSYMPEDFDTEIIWCSNGKFNGPDDVISSFSEGYGFAFFSGHGSPGYWGDQYPGIPGDRRYGSVDGLVVSNLRLYPPFISEQPAWPMKTLSNTGKLPITIVGGCHNSLINVSLIPSATQYYIMRFFGRDNGMWTGIQLVPQCWSWYMVQLPNTGSIATIGNTGLGWGWEGEFCTVGAGDGWISSEFFKQYGEHYGQEGNQTLGQVYLQTQTSYVNSFKDFTLPECWWFPDLGWDYIDAQAVQQWILLGDPSLMIGGYQQ